MNDNDLLTAVKEDFVAVRMDIPSQVIMRAGTSRRRRRRAQGLAMTALAAAGLGLAIAALTSGVSAGNARLAAWTVARQPGGAVAVTIRELQDTPGLQQELNADGVRAVVYNDVAQVPGCLDVNDVDQLGTIISSVDAPTAVDSDYFVIQPAAIPAGTTLQIDVMPYGSNPPDIGIGQTFPSGTAIGGGFGYGSPVLDAPLIFLSLVYTSGSC